MNSVKTQVNFAGWTKTIPQASLPDLADAEISLAGVGESADPELMIELVRIPTGKRLVIEIPSAKEVYELLKAHYGDE